MSEYNIVTSDDLQELLDTIDVIKSYLDMLSDGKYKSLSGATLSAVLNFQNILLALQDKGLDPTTANIDDSLSAYIQFIKDSNLLIPEGILNITENGEKDVSKYEKVNINVPQPTGTLVITENGEKNVSQYEKVNVNIPFISYYTGTTDPSSSLGQNNDIYLKTT